VCGLLATRVMARQRGPDQASPPFQLLMTQFVTGFGSSMIVISSHFAVGATTVRTAVCIVGAGAAGITLACELDGSGIDVLLLEAGGIHDDSLVDTDFIGHANQPHAGTTEFRRAGFGGTTSIWGGRCVPLDPVDFERRDHIPESGWPISYQEVARYYPRAMQYCEAGHADFSVGTSLRRDRPTIDGLGANNILVDRIERYSRPTDFGRCYRRRLVRSQNVTAVLYARCINLVHDAHRERMHSLIMVDRGGRRIEVEAEAFVLASGGIEVARLLLNSGHRAAGFGNRYDKLGRYYSCHFENVCASLVPGPIKPPFPFEKTVDGIYARRKLQFSRGAQFEYHLLNSAFRLHFPPYSDASHGSAVMSAIYLAKSALIPEYADILNHGKSSPVVSPTRAHIANVVTGLPRLLGFGLQWLFLMQLAQRKLPYTLEPNRDNSYPIEFNCEQTPLAHNRVALTDELDRHGLRRVCVHWSISQSDIDATHRGFLLLRDTLSKYSSCQLKFDERQLRCELEKSVPLGGHHMGTARMASTPREGVVDRNCALFEARNLYIASAAVFPTSGHANPTLTIVALAIRLAEHLMATVPGTARFARYDLTESIAPMAVLTPSQ
jgi:choline dehydrogenase-like flavoprotein